MENSSLSLAGYQQSSFGSYVYNRDYSPKYSRTFTHGGFGSGDGHYPVEGWYNITESFGCSGTDREYLIPPNPAADIVTTGNNLDAHDNSRFTPGSIVHSPTDIYNTALDRLYEAIRGSGTGAAETAGESLRAGSEFLAKYESIPANRNSPNLGDLLNRRLGSAKAVAKSGGSAWLAWAFGVKPGLETLHAVSEQITKQLTTELKSARGRASRHEVLSGNVWKVGRNTTTTSSRGDRCELGCSYFIVDPDLFSASLNGFTNPALLAWQLTRASFLADWVWNFGNYLDRLENSFGFGLQYVHGYRTDVQKTNLDWTVHYAGPDPGGRHVLCYARGARIYTSKQRQRLGGFPRPELPSFKPPIKSGSQRVLHLAALLTNLIT